MVGENIKNHLLTNLYNKEVYNKVITSARNVLKDRLYAVILYGSVARGEATWESDIDIALFVSNYNSHDSDMLLDYIVDIQLEYDVVISLLYITISEFTIWSKVLLFYKNIKKDGKILWKKTELPYQNTDMRMQ